MPLEKLRLMVAGLATRRAEVIDHLNRNARILSCPRVYREVIVRDKRIRTRINEVLLGIRVPAAKSTNWPSVVQTDLSSMPLLKKSCDLNEGGICHYRNGKEK
jgi:hypothetical protein